MYMRNTFVQLYYLLLLFAMLYKRDNTIEHKLQVADNHWESLATHWKASPVGAKAVSTETDTRRRHQKSSAESKPLLAETPELPTS